jgi:hypothetical protein
MNIIEGQGYRCGFIELSGGSRDEYANYGIKHNDLENER